jgi:hypothetical protein
LRLRKPPPDCMSSAATLPRNRPGARWIRLWRYPRTAPVLRGSRCDGSIRYRKRSWHRMRLRSGEERNRTVHKIARRHEVLSTEILISPRLLSCSTSSAPRFQARQMRLIFQVGSSVRRWAFAINPGFRPLFYPLRLSSSFRCGHAEQFRPCWRAALCRRANGGKLGDKGTPLSDRFFAYPASVHLFHETSQPYEGAVHDSLSGIASTARRLGKVSDHSPK